MMFRIVQRLVLFVLVSVSMIGCGNPSVPVVSAEGQDVRTYLGLTNGVYKYLTGKGVTVAVIDSGLTPSETVPTSKVKAFVDFVNYRHDSYDDNGHGSLISGMIAGSKMMQGIAPDADLVVVKALDEDLQSDLKTLINSLKWVYENKEMYDIKIINLSVGIPNHESDETREVQRLIHLLRESGVLLVCSAGNGGPHEDTILFPGTSSDVLTVGSVTSNQTDTLKDDSLTGFSGRANPSSRKPDLVTLGVDIRSMNGMGKFSTRSGTSYSAAIVTGALAVLTEKWGDSGMDEVEHILKLNLIILTDPQDTNARELRFK